ncbi:PP0621 family protein, partial [Achromobacter sp. AGC39]
GKAARSAPAPAAPESMVRCAHCGIHLPRSEAVLVNGMTWCSTEHSTLGPARK